MATEKPSAPKPGVIDIPFSAGRADNFSPATAPRGEILKSAAVAPRASSATEETPITRANLSMKPQPRASEKSPTPVDEDGIPFLTNEGPEGTSLKHALGITGKTDARRSSYSPIPQYITLTGSSAGAPTPGKRKKAVATKTVDNKYGGTREDAGNSRTYYKLSDIVGHLASRKHMSDKDRDLHEEYSTRLAGHQKRIEERKAAGETVPTLKDNRTFINSTFHLPKGRVHSEFIMTGGSRKKVQFTHQNIHDAIKKAGGTHLSTIYPYTED